MILLEFSLKRALMQTGNTQLGLKKGLFSTKEVPNAVGENSLRTGERYCTFLHQRREAWWPCAKSKNTITNPASLSWHLPRNWRDHTRPLEKVQSRNRQHQNKDPGPWQLHEAKNILIYFFLIKLNKSQVLHCNQPQVSSHPILSCSRHHFLDRDANNGRWLIYRSSRIWSGTGPTTVFSMHSSCGGFSVYTPSSGILMSPCGE